LLCTVGNTQASISHHQQIIGAIAHHQRILFGETESSASRDNVVILGRSIHNLTQDSTGEHSIDDLEFVRMGLAQM